MLTQQAYLEMNKASAVFIRLIKIRRLVGQSLSALCTASLQNGSAVGSLHSLSEAMLLFSLTLLRLISSKHLLHLLTVIIGSVCHSPRLRTETAQRLFLRFYTMTSYIIHDRYGFCQEVF